MFGNPSHRHGQVKVLPLNFCSFHQILGQVGEGIDTRCGGAFQQDYAVRERYREGTSEPRRDTQDLSVDTVENADVAKINRAVLRALTRLRAATSEHIDHEQVAEKQQAASRAKFKENLAQTQTKHSTKG